jgi:hypothetical protein
MNALMLEATRLTRAHRLDEATALIQRMLRGELDQGGSPAARPAPLPHFYGETQSGDREFGSLSWTLLLTDRFQRYSRRGYQRQTARFAPADLVPEGATFHPSTLRKSVRQSCLQALHT